MSDGARPEETTSLRESICRPNSLLLPEARAMRPSSESKTAAKKMNQAALTKLPAAVNTAAMKPEKRFRAVKTVGMLITLVFFFIDHRDHALPGAQSISFFNRYCCPGRDKDFHSGTKFDDAEFLTGFNMIAHAQVANHAAGRNASHLFEYKFTVFGLQPDDGVLVFFRSFVRVSRMKFPSVVPQVFHHSFIRNVVDMHIEY